MNKSEKFWDKSAKGYDNRTIDWDNIYNEAVERTKEYLNDLDVLLEFACGAGVITAQLAECVKEVHANDISAKMLEAAQRFANERNIKNIHFEKTTIYDDKYKEEEFNVITAFNIIHLLEDPQLDLQRINSLLKPGGLFISETLSLGEKGAFLGKILWFLSKIRLVPYVKPLKFSDLEILLEEENFEIIEAEDLEQKRTNYFIVAKKK